MEEPRPEKVAVVSEIREKLDAANGALLTEYRGLNVAALADLRRQLTAAGGDYKIYKNTLVRFAARDLGLDLDSLLTGPTAIAFVEGDAVNVAKALRDFARANPALVVKGGTLSAKVLDADRARALADVAPREELLARLAGGLAAPMQQFAGLISALPRNFAYGLKALIDQGGAPGAPRAAADAVPADAVPADAVPGDAAGAAIADADAPAAEDTTIADGAPAAEAPHPTPEFDETDQTPEES